MLEGEISEIQLVERLVELWREQFTGAIRFESDGIIKIIYFKGGDILSASTNDRADSVDEILMRAGKVSREHVKQALAKRKENETLGDALLNLGFITRKELTWARRVQVVGVIRSIAAWETGSFTIVADYLPKRDEGTLFPLPQVLTELIVTDQDRQKFERAMDGGNAVFAKSADFDDVFRKLGLNEQADAIARQVDGSKSVADVATASGGETFNVYKLLHALATLGVLQRTDHAAAAAQPQFALDDFASAGVADAADVWTQSQPQPQPQPQPTFELDETAAMAQPTLEIQTPSSAWDEEEEPAPPPITSPPPPEKMPAWDVPPRASAPAPLPIPVTPPAEPEEEQWGFDEAQIEAARRGTTAAASKPAATPKRAQQPKKSRRGLLVALLVIVLVAGAGYAGFLYWQKREAEGSAPLPVTRAARRVPAPVTTAATTTTSATTTETATTTTATATTTAAATTTAPTTTTVASTTTTAPRPTPPAPHPTPATTTVADTTTALPPVTPRPAAAAANDVRATYDAMARKFLANASGNFTVQVQILCEPSNLAKALSQGGSNVWFVPQPVGGRSCYRVFWGRYATREEAQRAMASIPADVRDRSAAVKPVPKG